MSTTLEDKGFVILTEVVSNERIDLFKEACKRAYDSQLDIMHESMGNNLLESMKKLYSGDYERYTNTTSALWRMVESADLFHGGELREGVLQAMGTNSLFEPGGMVVHVMASSLKFKGGYFGFPAHQDFPSIGGSLDGVVVWIPIFDVDELRFPVEVIPGSHKSGMWGAEKKKNSSTINPELYSDGDFVPVCCNAGDAVIMSNFLVHRSSAKGDDRLRLAVSKRYCNGLEKSFVFRSFPTAYTRSVNRLNNSEVKELLERFST